MDESWDAAMPALTGESEDLGWQSLHEAPMRGVVILPESDFQSDEIPLFDVVPLPEPHGDEDQSDRLPPEPPGVT